MFVSSTKVVLIVVTMGRAFGNNFDMICSDGNDKTVEVKPSEDGVAGRYTVKYCAPLAVSGGSTEDPQWSLVVNTLKPSVSAAKCSYAVLGDFPKSYAHSRIDVLLQTHINCSYVCLTKTMDLMYRNCYRIYNIIEGTREMRPYVYYYFANNTIGPDYFQVTQTLYKPLVSRNMVLINWYTGHIPITQFEASWCPNKTEACENVTDKCTVGAGGFQLSCDMRPHGDGCGQLKLRHSAPWKDNDLFQNMSYVHMDYCPKHIVTDDSGVGGKWVPWVAAVGVSLIVLAALLVVALWRHRWDAKKLRNTVQDVWRSRASLSALARAWAGGGGGEVILLLYARDCCAAGRVARALYSMLNYAVPGKVVDLYDPSTVARHGAEGGGGGWVRAAMGAGGAARVVLLQTPALVDLHGQRYGDQYTLEEPLIPNSVVYREPHFADPLLQYALRLLREGAQLGHDYQRYYIANAGVNADAVPGVTQLRRYPLPAAADLLLQHIAAYSPPDTQDALQKYTSLKTELADAVAELQDYVRTNPNYLNNLCIFFPRVDDKETSKS